MKSLFARALVVGTLLSIGTHFEVAADFPVGRTLTVSIESVDPATQHFTFR